MRALLILAASCVPLGALTVASFVELASIQQRVPTEELMEELAGAVETAEAEPQWHEAERRLVQQMAAVDVFAAEPVDAGELPEGSPLEGAIEAWGQWNESWMMVDHLLRLAKRGGDDDVEELRQLCADLASFQEQYGNADVPGRRLLLMVAERQRQKAAGRIKRLAQRDEAYALWDRCRQQFRLRQYETCVADCDRLLAQYGEVLDAADAAQAKALRQRAEFWDGALKLYNTFQATRDLTERKKLLEPFIARYSSWAGRGDAEQRVLDWCRQQLEEVENQLAQHARREAARREMTRLQENLPQSLPQRIQSAAEIVRRYPETGIREELRKSAVAWLDEFLPAKAIEEHELLQEAEGLQGEIIRGFFKENRTPDGELIGYEYYRTYEQFINPRSAVGTLRLSQLRRPPDTSVLRRCVTAYNEARVRLLRQLGQRAAWEAFAAECEALEDQLRRYRAKAGSSKEPLSFAAEARLARSLLAGDTIEQLAVLFGR